MDSTVIKEIADQLGMAVDSTAQFMMEILPHYATMKILSSLGTLLFFIGLCLFMAEMVLFCWYKYIDDKRISSYHPISLEDMIKEKKEAKNFTILVVLSLIISIFCFVGAPIIQWLVVPDAMFFQQILKAIG